jgi:hypothetical protein
MVDGTIVERITGRPIGWIFGIFNCAFADEMAELFVGVRKILCGEGYRSRAWELEKWRSFVWVFSHLEIFLFPSIYFVASL